MALQKSKTTINSAKIGDAFYPSLLKELNDAPSVIYFLGELSDDDASRVAIVGTRKATQAGLTLARQIARELAAKGIVIVSGLAMGIDAAAHEGALAAKGKTLAVLANGLDFIYPAQNENLAERILASGGAIISEYPRADTPTFPSKFLDRNRLVSGLCAATAIIEAPLRSGSLVTARLAAEQGREVFVFPGPVNHPNYRGSHKLIRDGARLVAGAEDILEDLGFEPASTPANQMRLDLREGDSGAVSTEQKIILAALKEAGIALGIDKIIAITKLEPQIVNRALAFLLLNNIIKETELGYIL